MAKKKAEPILKERSQYPGDAFAELVVWKVPAPVVASLHNFKYRLAYVVKQRCVLRYDNETRKGDHWHYNNSQRTYEFRSVEQLIQDFYTDIERWNDENNYP